MKPRLSRWPFVLLGAMTVFSFGGPLAIGYVLRGGGRSTWPPDRPIEWVTVVGISGMVALLMMACLSLALINRRPISRAESPKPGPSRAES